MTARQMEGLGWAEIRSSLWASGYGRVGTVLTRAQCQLLRGLYADSSRFRSRIEMERFRFGQGEYQYFAYPLPGPVARLRHSLYAQLAGTANQWMEALGLAGDYPADLDAFLDRCHRQGQKRPTPLLLRYRAGGYNCLHQDLYGDIAFPFQAIFCLSRPGDEFTGGELLLVEQRPRAQSAGRAVRLDLPLDIRATAFQMLVWNYLQTIPYGEVQSYGEVAKAIGRPKAVRAVARACASNRVAVAIPCHRVIRGTGELGGYRWGLARQRAILDRERAAARRAS